MKRFFNVFKAPFINIDIPKNKVPIRKSSQ